MAKQPDVVYRKGGLYVMQGLFYMLFRYDQSDVGLYRLHDGREYYPIHKWFVEGKGIAKLRKGSTQFSEAFEQVVALVKDGHQGAAEALCHLLGIQAIKEDHHALPMGAGPDMWVSVGDKVLVPVHLATVPAATTGSEQMDAYVALAKRAPGSPPMTPEQKKQRRKERRAIRKARKAQAASATE